MNLIVATTFVAVLACVAAAGHSKQAAGTFAGDENTYFMRMCSDDGRIVRQPC